MHLEKSSASSTTTPGCACRLRNSMPSTFICCRQGKSMEHEEMGVKERWQQRRHALFHIAQAGRRWQEPEHATPWPWSKQLLPHLHLAAHGHAAPALDAPARRAEIARRHGRKVKLQLHAHLLDQCAWPSTPCTAGRACSSLLPARSLFQVQSQCLGGAVVVAVKVGLRKKIRK